ncbi:hypothetical protein D9619_009602 [Psilocybe cf. subviscida]|uniref:Uncharacterized protein n=1 Tax=Psilocybe cf. subviscida TaxID=2480587 RepID=A0A8H5F6I0_9AGAR|nr:hypothetical protein D9619_009602 [Psilocybe cf. subviscida]
MPSNTKPVSILALPTETLLEVFHILYDNRHLLPRLGLSAKFEPPRINQFPHNVFNVSKGWRSLLRSTVGFWARIEIYVDNPEVHKDLEKKLCLSGTQAIEVFIIRKDYSEDVNDLKEHIIVNGIVKQLIPHVERCEVLHFDVLHSTSIPLINSFSGTSMELRKLRIRCRRGPAGPKILQRQPPLRLQPFICPSLRQIDLHGRAFIEATRIPHWLNNLRRLPGKELVISDLTREEAGEYNLRDLIMSLACIGHLSLLTLRNIDLDVGDYATPVKGLRYLNRAPATLHIQNFDFFGLSAEFIQGFFGAYDNKIDVSRLIITKCGIAKIDGFEAWELLLRNLDASERDLIHFLEGWDGFSLQLFNVTSGVTDKLFERLSCTTPNTLDKNLFCMPTLRQLTIISDAPLPLSTEMLKEMVLARKDEADKYLNIPSTTHFLPLFSVTVIRSINKISDEDRALMSDALEEFYWAGPKEEKQTKGETSIDDCLTLEQGGEPPVKAESAPSQTLTIDRSDSPVLDSDCADWDFSQFNDSQIGALIPPSAASQTAATFGTMKLDPAKEPSRSSSPFVNDDYCNIDWSSLDVGANST